MATDRERIPPAEHEGILSRAAIHLHQWMCGLNGHDSMRHFDHGRITLLCSSCGHQTPGWDVAVMEPPPADVAPVNDAAPRVVRMPLVQARRVA